MGNVEKPLTAWRAMLAIACACIACEVPDAALANVGQEDGSDTAVYIMPYLSGSDGAPDAVAPTGPDDADPVDSADPDGPVKPVEVIDPAEPADPAVTPDAESTGRVGSIAPNPATRSEGVSTRDAFPRTGDEAGFLPLALGIVGAGAGISLAVSLGSRRDVNDERGTMA